MVNWHSHQQILVILCIILMNKSHHMCGSPNLYDSGEGVLITLIELSEVRLGYFIE